MKQNEQSTTNIIATAANNAAVAAKNASEAAASASQNAQIAAKAAAESATAIAIVATDTSWMKGSLKRLEEVLDNVSKSFVTSSQHQDVLKELAEHETRLNVLETEKTRVTVLLGITVGIGSLLISLLVYHIMGN